MAKSTAVSRFSVAKTKTGVMNTLYLIAGLFVGGLLEQYAMSKVAFLADTKTDAAGVSSKNTVGVILKSAAYIIGGLGAGQMSSNEMVKWAGYGLASYGGLKAAKTVSDVAKPYGLGTVHQQIDVTYPQYQLNGGGQSVSSR